MTKKTYVITAFQSKQNGKNADLYGVVFGKKNILYYQKNLFLLILALPLLFACEKKKPERIFNTETCTRKYVGKH